MNDLVEERFIFQLFFTDLDHIYQHIGIFKSRFHKVHHRLLKLVGRLNNSGCITQDHLEILPINDP